MTRRVVASFALVALTGLSGPAHAVDDDLGTPGYCPGDDGVTVVVDFQQLGGAPLVRCAPGSESRSGLDVLKAAGFQVEGVQRWGEAFICRIEDRPSVAEAVPLDGNEDYREACIDTPPSTAYWGYYHADAGGDWTFSGAGGKTREVRPGGFEGWSFALGTPDGEGSQPSLAPARPRPGAQQVADGGTEQPDLFEARGEQSQPWPAIAGVGVAMGLGGVALLVSRRRRGRASP